MSGDEDRAVMPATWVQRPRLGRPADKSTWQPCSRCHRSIPVVRAEDEATYVCPFCEYSRIGVAEWTRDARDQTRCYGCEAELGEGFRCVECGYPRGWIRVHCPGCRHVQPVHAPHWVVGCDVYTFECFACEWTFESLCIC